MISDEIRLQCTVTRKKIVKICMAVVVLATIRLAVLLIETRQEIHKISTQTRSIVDRPNRTESGHRILLWIRYKSDFKIDKQRMCMQKCPVQCTLTDDKNAAADASAIVFVLTSVWAENWELGTKKLVDLPVRRDADQVWVLSNLEPPANMFGDLAALNGIFNWTMWYRSDADIHIPYSEPRRLTTEEAIRNIEKMKTRNIFSEKTKEITGKVSNCVDAGRRYRIVGDLQKHLNIEMYGKCYNNICGDPQNHTSCDDLTKKYKFYLALENSYCRDYVTEKYWQTLHRDQIPIVNWDYSMVRPDTVIPDSFISLRNFRDTAALASYIQRVSEDKDLYNRYFQWHAEYDIQEPCATCSVCRALHEGRPRKVVENLEAWIANDTCPKVGVLNKWVASVDNFLFSKLGI